MTGRSLQGGCFCGAVGYRVADAFEWAVNCHCGNCRRATGAAFKPLAGIAREKLVFTRGEDATMSLPMGEGAERWHSVHCGRCGSLLFALVRGETFAHVAMGTLIDAPTIRPQAHVFVASKAPWFEITDDLPQYPGHAPPR